MELFICIKMDLALNNLQWNKIFIKFLKIQKKEIFPKELIYYKKSDINIFWTKCFSLIFYQ